MSNNIIILFYSNHCKHSHHILQLLQQAVFYDNVKKINIESGEYKIPSSITSVPALIVPGVRYPLVGNNAFIWINNALRQQQQQMQHQQQPNTNNQNQFNYRTTNPHDAHLNGNGNMNMNGQNNRQNNRQNTNNDKKIDNKGNDGIFASHMEGISVYTPELSSAFSDNYCGLDDAYKTLDKQSTSMVHTFAPANIEVMPSFDQHLQNKKGKFGDNTIKSDDFNRRLDEFKKSRDISVKRPPPQQQQQQRPPQMQQQQQRPQQMQQPTQQYNSMSSNYTTNNSVRVI